MLDPKKSKMAGVNSRFERSIKSALNGFFLQMCISGVVEINSFVYTEKKNYSF